MSLLLCLRLGPVDEKQFVGGSCEGGVKPVYVVGREHVVGHVALVYIYVCPLSALRLVAGHGVSVFYLKSVVVGVFLQLLVAFGLGGHVGIIEHHLLEELLILVVRECRRFGRERVGNCRDLQLVVVVVGESKPKVDEVESVQVAMVAHALYHGTVAVGYERWGRATLLLVV